jgi:hypothetical protein
MNFQAVSALVICGKTMENSTESNTATATESGNRKTFTFLVLYVSGFVHHIHRNPNEFFRKEVARRRAATPVSLM